MTPERYRQIRDIYLRVRELGTLEQGRAVRDACGADSDLETQVLRLLRASEQASTSHGDGRDEALLGAIAAAAIEALTPSVVTGSSAELQPGDQVDRYRLVSMLGQGGFGDVFLAEQSEPIRRRVALKVIKPGMDSREVIARFEQERQALAVMDHPNIAKVIDAGTTRLGRPYFVMEYVAGEPLTAYCDRQGLTVAARLELFTPVCEAIQHAHLKGIIHRDIKPSNILVTLRDGRPVPVVIDFGVAKAINRGLTGMTVFSESGAMIGTPEYMSPEQADPGRADIDTRTDIYSLGVVLYEMLVGAVPFDGRSLRRAGYAEIQRVIREVEPPRPSTRLSQLGERAAEIAMRRQTRPEDLARTLFRELEWLPLMAMRKERSQRYQTAKELAEDIQRYLRGEALLAGPESRWYRARKFVRRNRLAVGAVALVAASLFGATVVSAVFWLRAARDRDITSAVSEFLDSDVLGQAASQGGDPSLRMLDVMRYADRSAGSRFASSPHLEAAIRERLANAFIQLGEPAATLKQIERLDAISTKSGGAGMYKPDERTLELESLRAEALYRLGDAPAGFGRLQALLASAERSLGPLATQSIELLNQLGGLQKSAGLLDEAEVTYRTVLQRRTTTAGPMSAPSLIARHNLALVQLQRSNVAATEADRTRLLERALTEMQSVASDMASSLGPTDHVTLESLAEVPPLMQRLGRNQEAQALYERVLPQLDQVLGEDHWRTVDIRTNAGTLYLNTGQPDRAVEAYTSVIPALVRRFGAAHATTLKISLRKAAAYAAQSNADAAERTLEQTLAGIDAIMPPVGDVARSRFLNDAAVVLENGGWSERAAVWRARAEAGRR